MATWSDNSGKSTYGASAHGDVLVIVSECESHPNPDVVQRRAASELTEEWRGKLENQGIARENQQDDLSLVKARYDLDKQYTIVGVEMSSPGGERLTRDRVLEKIRTIMKNSDGTKGGKPSLPSVLEWAQQSDQHLNLWLTCLFSCS